MYQKEISRIELAKKKKEQERLDLRDTIIDKVFICKKDIVCCEGTFKRGTPVFLEGDKGASIGKIYDMTQWKDINLEYNNCFSDYCKKRITKKELSEYFEYNNELTLAFTERKRTADALWKKSQEPFLHISDRFNNDTIQSLMFLLLVLTSPILFGLVMISILYLITFLLTWHILKAMIIVFVYTPIIGAVLYCKHKRKKATDKYKEYVKTAIEDLKELAFRGECRAACYRVYEDAKEQE